MNTSLHTVTTYRAGQLLGTQAGVCAFTTWQLVNKIDDRQRERAET